ncbi:hypothetical protein MKW94_007783 [Papaver nudicaule]|uniref:Protein kinase domain-containing protein n=1 Tax=Papaver nudicaule TaxID=74823 RepID=A0AA41S1T0_PAPNU|nr:hypothetical protein [Papaver nudicaule]
MWSVGCIFAELLHGKAIMPGKTEPEQVEKIYDLCGSPDEVIWPGVSKLPWYNNFKPALPKKRRLREVFRHFDRHALELLGKMLTLDPSKRISAEDALKAEYFRADPLPCDPKSLPRFVPSHEFQIKKKRQQQEEAVKRQKLQHPPQQHERLPSIQHSGQSHPQSRPGRYQPMHHTQPPVAAGPSHHYGKRPSGGPNRYPRSGKPDSPYPSRGGQGGDYGSRSYAPQGRGAPYQGHVGGSRGYAAGDSNIPQSRPYESSSGGRYSNRNQPYGGWQQ